MKINKRTSHFLDLSRAASAFLVLIGHIHMVLFVDIEKSKLFSVGSFFNFISSYAHQAVIVFFVLSGFLVGRSAINSISENNLNNNGLLALEIGTNQEKVLSDIMSVSFYKIKIVKDYCRRNRFIMARKK